MWQMSQLFMFFVSFVSSTLDLFYKCGVGLKAEYNFMPMF